MYYIQNILSGASSITSFITLSTTVLGVFALLLSNLARYFQANKFGIPIKAIHQASVGDSIGIWITLVGSLGFGIFIPFLLFNAELNWWIIYAAMIITCFFGILISKCYVIGGKKEKRYNGQVFVYETDKTALSLAYLSPAFALGLMHLRSMYRHAYVSLYETAFAEGFFRNVLMYSAFIVAGIYILMLIPPLIYTIKEKLFGGMEKMVTEIDGKTYLVAMRNSQYAWILIHCELIEVKYDKMKISTLYVRFEKGKFIICDMSHPPREVKRLKNYGLMEKGVLKKEGEEKKDNEA